MTERGVAGAEVVERDLHAELAQLDEAAEGAVDVVEHRRLGDLEAELAGVERAVGDRHLDPPEHLVGAGDLRSAEVDPHPQRPVELQGAQVVQRMQDLIEHPLADIGQQAGGLGDGEELVGEEHRPLRARPAHERFEPDDAAVDEADHRLEVGAQDAVGDGRVQLGLDALGPHDRPAQLLDVLGGRVALLLARRTAGQLRLAEQSDAGVAAGEAGAHVGALSRLARSPA